MMTHHSITRFLECFQERLDLKKPTISLLTLISPKVAKMLIRNIKRVEKT